MPYPEVQILVCTNDRGPEAEKPSCAQRGGLEVYRRFKDAIRERGLRDTVIVTRTGCLKRCSQGITVGVWPWNVWYRGVTIEDVGGAGLYFLSDLSSGVTGEIHHVDAGYNVVGMKAEDAPDISTV